MVLQVTKYQSVLRRLRTKLGRGHNDWGLHQAVSRNKGKLYMSIAGSLILFSGTVVALQVTDNNQSPSDQSATVQGNENVSSSVDLNATNSSSADSSNNNASNSVDTETENGRTSVTVNGQTVPVPNNGTTHTTITGNGTNDVNVTVSSNDGNTSVNTYSSSSSIVNNSGNTSVSSSFSTQSVMNNGGTQ
jgi:hypothetical protein